MTHVKNETTEDGRSDAALTPTPRMRASTRFSKDFAANAPAPPGRRFASLLSELFFTRETFPFFGEGRPFLFLTFLTRETFPFGEGRPFLFLTRETFPFG